MHIWSKDGATALGEWTPSKDGSKLLYAIQDGGSDWRVLKVLDVATGQVLADEVKWVKFSGLAWAKNGSGFFYSRFPEPKEGETFQQLNTNTGIEGSWERTARIAELARANGKELVVYISMAFGNPYGDAWSPEVALHWVDRLVKELGVGIIALSDTVGVARPEDITSMFRALIPALPTVEFGAHLHCTPENWKAKTQAAWDGGCRRFDGAIKGYGGCPMAEDELVGNLQTELFVHHLDDQGIRTGLDLAQLDRCVVEAASVFPG